MLSFLEFIMENTTYYYHVTYARNWKTIQHKGLTPSVGKRSRKLSEKPAIFLFGSKDDAEDALMNWLGDELEGYPVILLQVSLPPGVPAHKVAFEYQVFQPIPPQYIRNLGEI